MVPGATAEYADSSIGAWLNCRAGLTPEHAATLTKLPTVQLGADVPTDGSRRSGEANFGFRELQSSFPMAEMGAKRSLAL